MSKGNQCWKCAAEMSKWRAAHFKTKCVKCHANLATNASTTGVVAAFFGYAVALFMKSDGPMWSFLIGLFSTLIFYVVFFQVGGRITKTEDD
jgi:nicotinamide riboside transporter PnuC